MAIMNTWQFLIKQRKYKTWPLLMFYILTIWLSSMRIYTSLFYFFYVLKGDIVAYLLTPILNLNVGAVQCWILFELGLKVTLNIRLVESLQRNAAGGREDLEPSQLQFDSSGREKINNLIWYGRCFLMVVIPLELVSLIVYFSIETARLDLEDSNNLV